MVFCVVPGCGSKEADRKNGISFFAFPKETDRRTVWLNVIGITERSSTTGGSGRVCSKHFLATDFESNDVRAAYGTFQPKITLKREAVPQIDLQVRLVLRTLCCNI